jgi:hypothetical protein
MTSCSNPRSIVAAGVSIVPLIACLLSPSLAHAQVPSPTYSTLPSHIFLVGQSNGVPDPCGAFTVRVMTDAPSEPYKNGTVSIDFANTPDLDFAVTQNYLGETADCASRRIVAITDLEGYAHFDIVGSLIHHPGSGPVPACILQISCDGVILGNTSVSAFDIDAVNGVNANDASLWEGDLLSPSCGLMCVEDYTGNGSLSNADYVELIDAITFHQQRETGDLCGGQPSASVVNLSGGIALTVVDCGGFSFSTNYCTGGYTDLIATVTLPSSLDNFTGMEAIVKIRNATGEQVPDFWRFDGILTTCAYGNVLGGCDRGNHLSAIPGDNNTPNGDPNCIGASSVYDINSLAPGGPTAVMAEAIWPDPGSGLSDEEQVRVLYAEPGIADYGSISAAVPTVVFGLRINHSGHTQCAGCDLSSQILFSVEQIRLTSAVPGKNPGCAAQPITRFAASRVNDVPTMIIITPAAGDSNEVYADGTRPNPPVSVGAPSFHGMAWLAPCAPNPSGTGTTLAFYVPHETSVDFAIYDVSGRIIRRLTDGVRPAGEHSVRWDGRRAEGDLAANGMYFVRMHVGAQTLTRTVVVRK